MLRMFGFVTFGGYRPQGCKITNSGRVGKRDTTGFIGIQWTTRRYIPSVMDQKGTNMQHSGHMGKNMSN